MELEEGIADYASWVMLYELGLTDRDAIIRRYNATQKEPFYLTGAMQLHALSLLKPNETQKVIETIIDSKTVEEGSLTNLLAAALKTNCDVTDSKNP